MDHNDIRNKLSEYIDGAVTPGEKATIEQHLKTCSECADALRELRKTIEHIHAVEEVESPAWMTQKIMAKVRTDAEEKKDWLHRLFYPLAVKLPIRTVAVLFLTVTAYYIYSSINPAQKYAEEQDGMLAKKDAPAIGRMKEERKAIRESAPEAKQASRKPGYKSLDMKYSYETPAEPVPLERPAASAPAPAKGETQMYAQDKSDIEKRSTSPMAETVAPSMMAEQATSASGAANQSEEKKKSTVRSASNTKSANDINNVDLQKYIGRHENELSSFNEISTDKSDQGASIIGKDHVLLTRKIKRTLVIFFAKYINSNKPGTERDAVITDSMLYPASGDNINLLSWWCASNGLADIELMAVVNSSRRLERLPAINAWRMNRKTGKFQAIDPSNITCINESYGN